MASSAELTVTRAIVGEQGARAPGVVELGANSRSFGDYELLEEVARGGMGVVYKARQRSLGRTVAVKMILAGEFAGREFVQRFRAEAAAAAILQHPNIVPVHEVGVCEGKHFFSMEYVEGQDLAELVGNRALPPRQAAEYVRAVAEAVHYAHSKGILHRDLKPSNVLIEAATNRPRVTDFGLAKRLDGSASLTVTGQLLGSPNFMAPEQASAGKGRLSFSSDVYGLGGILYFLLTARAPFQGEALEAIVLQVTQSEPIAPSRLNPGLPLDLETICLKCLEKEPASRYATAQELADELGRFLQDQPIRARPATRAERAWRWCRRKPVIAGLGTATVLLLLALGIGSPIAAYRINQARLKAQRNLYATDMILAQQALEMNNIRQARDLLKDPGWNVQSHLGTRTDLRGWEWRYLSQQSRSDELAELGPCPLGAHGVVLSPDGKLLAAMHCDSPTFQVWDIPARRVIGTNTGMERGGPWLTHFCAFSADSSVLAAPGAGGVLRRLHPRTLQEIAPRLKVAGEIGYVSYSPDGKMLTVVHPPTTNTLAVSFFDADDGQVVREVLLPKGSWTIAQDQSTAAVGLTNGMIEIYELARGRRMTNFYFGEAWPKLALSPEGTHLVIANDNPLRSELWDVTTAKKLDWASTHTSIVRYCVFSPDGRRFATTSYDQVVKLWDVSTGKEIKTLKGHESIVYCANFTGDGQTLVTGSKDETIRFWSTQPPGEPTNVRRLSSDANDSHVWLAPSGDTLLVVRSNAVFSIWNVLEWGSTEDRPIPVREFTCGAVSPGGRFAAFGNISGSVLLWDTALRRAVTTMQSNDDPIARLQFSADGSVLAVVENRWTGIWNVAGTNLTLQFPHRTATPTGWGGGTMSMCFSRTAELYAQAMGWGDVEIWNLVQRRSIGFWKADKKWVSAMAFSPDGKTIATSGYGDEVDLWDITTQRLVRTFKSSNLASLFAVAFSPDGRRLVGGTPEGPVKLWDVASGQELLTLKGHTSGIDGVSFLPDGDTLVSASRREVIRWVAPKLAQSK